MPDSDFEDYAIKSIDKVSCDAIASKANQATAVRKLKGANGAYANESSTPQFKAKRMNAIGCASTPILAHILAQRKLPQTDACLVCGLEIPLDILEIHVNNCLDGHDTPIITFETVRPVSDKSPSPQENSKCKKLEVRNSGLCQENTGSIKNGMGDLSFCVICGKDVTRFSNASKEIHLNACLDESVNSMNKDTDQGSSLDSLNSCPYCFQKWTSKSQKQKVLHLKPCSKKNRIPLEELMTLVSGEPATKRKGDTLHRFFKRLKPVEIAPRIESSTVKMAVGFSKRAPLPLLTSKNFQFQDACSDDDFAPSNICIDTKKIQPKLIHTGKDEALQTALAISASLAIEKELTEEKHIKFGGHLFAAAGSASTTFKKGKKNIVTSQLLPAEEAQSHIGAKRHAQQLTSEVRIQSKTTAHLQPIIRVFGDSSAHDSRSSLWELSSNECVKINQSHFLGKFIDVQADLPLEITAHTKANNKFFEEPIIPQSNGLPVIDKGDSHSSSSTVRPTQGTQLSQDSVNSDALMEITESVIEVSGMIEPMLANATSGSRCTQTDFKPYHTFKTAIFKTTSNQTDPIESTGMSDTQAQDIELLKQQHSADVKLYLDAHDGEIEEIRTKLEHEITLLKAQIPAVVDTQRLEKIKSIQLENKENMARLQSNLEKEKILFEKESKSYKQEFELKHASSLKDLEAEHRLQLDELRKLHALSTTALKKEFEHETSLQKASHFNELISLAEENEKKLAAQGEKLKKISGNELLSVKVSFQDQIRELTYNNDDHKNTIDNQETRLQDAGDLTDRLYKKIFELESMTPKNIEIPHTSIPSSPNQSETMTIASATSSDSLEINIEEQDLFGTPIRPRTLIHIPQTSIARKTKTFLVYSPGADNDETIDLTQEPLQSGEWIHDSDDQVVEFSRASICTTFASSPAPQYVSEESEETLSCMIESTQVESTQIQKLQAESSQSQHLNYVGVLPDYSHMTIPQLKKIADGYGYKYGPKGTMVKAFTEIWYKLNPTAEQGEKTGPSISLISKVNRAQGKQPVLPVSKNYKVIQVEKKQMSCPNVSLNPDVNQVETSQNPGGSKSKGKKKVDSVEEVQAHMYEFFTEQAPELYAKVLRYEVDGH